ncbi:MAG TPA: YciI family protein [Myxococcota bacterium]|nr:YciI family protein [Myxococcota bacterium]
MYVINLTYVRPLAEIDAAMRAHVAFLREMYARKVFLASGRKVPRTGGIILAHGLPRAELEALIATDPFVERGLATAEIIEFNASQRCEPFELVLAWAEGGT